MSIEFHVRPIKRTPVQNADHAGTELRIYLVVIRFRLPDVEIEHQFAGGYDQGLVQLDAHLAHLPHLQAVVLEFKAYGGGNDVITRFGAVRHKLCWLSNEETVAFGRAQNRPDRALSSNSGRDTRERHIELANPFWYPKQLHNASVVLLSNEASE